MALPIGLAIVRGLREVRCDRCGRRQIRAAVVPHPRCKFCHRPLPAAIKPR